MNDPLPNDPAAHAHAAAANLQPPHAPSAVEGPGGDDRGPGGHRPPQPGARRPEGATRPFRRAPGTPPPNEKPPNAGGMPQSLDRRDFAPVRPNSRDLDKMIEDELNAAMSGFSVEGTLAKGERTHGPAPAGGAGQKGKKKGIVAGVHGKDVFVDVPGGRGQGVLPIQQFERRPEVGDEVEFEIERYDAANGLLLLTKEGATQVVTDWSRVAYGMIVEAKVTEANKNKTGLLIEINGIKGFMPISQIDLYRVENIDQFVGQRLKCMVVEVNPEERNLLASRRALLEKERALLTEEFWKTIAEGQTRKGIVRGIKPFGAFVDLGGQDGLIPVSEMSWSRVGDPSELLKIGQTVEVLVQRVDSETRKIGLSLKQLSESPMEDYARRVRPGTRVIGKVTRLAEFGAFVELEPGVEGLLHVSELSTQRVRRVQEVVKQDQMVEVEILSIDAPNRRIGLSLKSIARAIDAAQATADEAERRADLVEAEERMSTRAVNPNLRGGIGSNQPPFGG